MDAGLLLKKLPDEIVEKTIGFKKKENLDVCLNKFLECRLPSSDIKEIEDRMKKRYYLTTTRASFKKRIIRKGCPQNPGLSNSKKRQLGLYTIQRKGLKFKDLITLHQCWKDYMTNLLNLTQTSRWKVDCVANEELTQLLWKADYHGACIRVCRSTNPSLVGIEGIMVFETRNTLKLLGRDDETRCVPKASCEFALKVGDLTVTFIGKHFLVKPTERAVKKVKGGKYFDL